MVTKTLEVLWVSEPDLAVISVMLVMVEMMVEAMVDMMVVNL